MGTPKVAIFWTDEDTHESKLNELLKGRLRQGWGAPRSSLLEGSKHLSLDQWAKNFVLDSKIWNYAPSIDECRSRYSILSRMLKLQHGDLVVVPRMPRAGKFCIARVTEGYSFDDAQYEGRQDFRHIVHVDIDLKNFRNDESPETTAISAKFRHYRSAVNIVADEIYAQKIRHLYAFGAE